MTATLWTTRIGLAACLMIGSASAADSPPISKSDKSASPRASERVPLQLLMTVRRGSVDSTRESSGNLTQTDRIRTSEQSANSTIATSSDVNVVMIRLADGGRARIAFGDATPVVTAVIAEQGKRPAIDPILDMRPADSSIEITPHVEGQHVAIDVTERVHTVDSTQQGLRVQAFATRVDGRLGDWLVVDQSQVVYDVGSKVVTRGATKQNIATQNLATRSDRPVLSIKVELVNSARASE